MRETVALHAEIISPHNNDTNRTRDPLPRWPTDGRFGGNAVTASAQRGRVQRWDGGGPYASGGVVSDSGGPVAAVRMGATGRAAPFVREQLCPAAHNRSYVLPLVMFWVCT
jgi:hypothetical protein